MSSALVLFVLTAALPGQELADLVTQLGDRDARTSSEAYTQLLRDRSPELLPLLQKALPGMPVHGQNYGLYLLQMFPLGETQGVLRKLLAGGPLLSGAAAAMLHRGGEKAMVPVITAALAAAEGTQANLLLSRLYGLSEPALGAAVRELLRPDGDPLAVESALSHLQLQHRAELAANVTAAERLLAAKDSRLRLAALAFLCACGQSRHGPALAAAMSSATASPYTVTRFLDHAGELDPALVDALVEMLGKANNLAQLVPLARVVSAQAPQRAIAPLERHLQTGDPAMRSAALAALCAIPGALETKKLLALLADPDPRTRLIAAETLRRMDDTSGFDIVLQLSRDGAHRVEALRVLGTFRRRAAVPVLLDGLADGQVGVRQAAFTALQATLPDLFPIRRFDLASSGYQPNGDSAARAAGLESLRRWWQQHGAAR